MQRLPEKKLDGMVSLKTVQPKHACTVEIFGEIYSMGSFEHWKKKLKKPADRFYFL